MLGPGMRATIKVFVFESFFNLHWIGCLRELGLTPEDPSREAYWVANGNRRRAGRR